MYNYSSFNISTQNRIHQIVRNRINIRLMLLPMQNKKHNILQLIQIICYIIIIIELY